MSAWECGNKTLSLVVDVIRSEEFQTKTGVPKTKKALMELLHSYNKWSLEERYEENEFMTKPRYQNIKVDEPQKWKSVGCYLYQCDYIPYDKMPQLLIDLENWYQKTAEQYDEESKDYDWDIDTPIQWRNLIYPPEHFESVMIKRRIQGFFCIQGIDKDGFVTKALKKPQIPNKQYDPNIIKNGYGAAKWLKEHGYKIHEHSIYK